MALAARCLTAALLLAGCPVRPEMACLPAARCGGAGAALSAFLSESPDGLPAVIEVVIWPASHDLLPEAPGFTQGLTHQGGLIEVTAPAVLCHEIGHLRQWGRGDPDAAHLTAGLFGPVGSDTVEGRCRAALDRQ